MDVVHGARVRGGEREQARGGGAVPDARRAVEGGGCGHGAGQGGAAASRWPLRARTCHLAAPAEEGDALDCAAVPRQAQRLIPLHSVPDAQVHVRAPAQQHLAAGKIAQSVHVARVAAQKVARRQAGCVVHSHVPVCTSDRDVRHPNVCHMGSRLGAGQGPRMAQYRRGCLTSSSLRGSCRDGHCTRRSEPAGWPWIRNWSCSREAAVNERVTARWRGTSWWRRPRTAAGALTESSGHSTPSAE